MIITVNGEQCLVDGSAEAYLRLVMDKLTAATAKVDELTKENDLRKHIIHGFPFCPDHRDKQSGKPCLACEIEKLREGLMHIAKRDHTGWASDFAAKLLEGK